MLTSNIKKTEKDIDEVLTLLYKMSEKANNGEAYSNYETIIEKLEKIIDPFEN